MTRSIVPQVHAPKHGTKFSGNSTEGRGIDLKAELAMIGLLSGAGIGPTYGLWLTFIWLREMGSLETSCSAVISAHRTDHRTDDKNGAAFKEEGDP